MLGQYGYVFGDLDTGELFFMVHSTLAIYQKTGERSCIALRGASGETPVEPYRYENTQPEMPIIRGCDDLRIIVQITRQQAEKAAV